MLARGLCNICMICANMGIQDDSSDLHLGAGEFIPLGVLP